MNTKQMFCEDDKAKRYEIIKKIRSCYLHECVRISICFQIIIQVKIKDMKLVWRLIGNIIFYFVLVHNKLNCQ